MSKKKNTNTELEWNDDQKNVEDLATRAKDALSSLLDDEVVASEGETTVDELNASPDSGDQEVEIEFEESELQSLAISEEPIDAGVVLDEDEASSQMNFSAEGTELEGFQVAEIDQVEEIPEDRIASIVESLLFATDRPQSIAVLKAAFKGSNVRSHHIRRALDHLQIEFAGARRGVYLEEVAGGYQLRTKPDNIDYLRRTIKARPFRVSGPALEVMSIVAYKQPIIKSQIDEIRGVESGHLLRALMEKGLVNFAGKSELPGKPMFYGTTRRFLEVFGLRNLSELPSLNEIDQLIPEGIGEVEEKETLDQLTGQLSKEAGTTYSEGEDELLKIASELEKVSTTTEFFEKEKARMKAERDQERARDLEEALAVGELIEETDRRWLDKFRKDTASAASDLASEVAAPPQEEPAPITSDLV